MRSLSRVSGLILISIAFDTAIQGENLTLTPVGMADGFSLTSFVNGFPGPSFSEFGPFGMAVASDGNVIVSSFFDARNYVLADVDGQSIANAITSASFPIFASSFAVSGGAVWATPGSGDNPVSLFKLSNNGAIDTAYSVPGLETTSGNVDGSGQRPSHRRRRDL